MKGIMEPLAFLLLATFIISGTNSGSIFLTRSGVQIIPIPENSAFGESIHGYRSCGGPGQLLGYRVTNCTANTLCTVYYDEPIVVDVDFVPSEDIPELGVRLNIVHDGEVIPIYESSIAASAVQAGVKYTARGYGGPTEDLRGMTATYQYVLYKISDDSAVVCSEAEINVV